MSVFPQRPMADITTLITDGKHGDCENSIGSGYYFLSSKDLRDGRLHYDDPRQITYEGFIETHRRTNLEPGDILLANCGASIGRVGIAQSDPRIPQTTFQKSISVIKANKKIVHNRYLYYFLLCNSELLVRLGDGTAQPNLLIGDLKRISVSVPPRPIQFKISGLLSAYDELIENNRRRIVLLEKLAEEVYREWFVRFRFPGHHKSKFVKGIPASWKVKKFGEIADFTMGQSPPSESYNDSGDGLPFHQGVGTYGSRFPHNITYCNTKGRKAQEGDILFSVRAPVGRLNIADCEMIIGRGLAAIRHKKGHNSYLFYLLKSLFATEDIIGNGAIFNSVGKDELASFEILQPDDQLIFQFQSYASYIDRQIWNLTRSVENLATTRDLLLPRLISGKLDLESLDIHFSRTMSEELAAPSSAAIHA